MIIRNYLKSSVRALCVLSIVSFIMIFIVSVALIENLHDKIKIFTPLTMQNVTTWGKIPGALNYTYTKELTLFDINNITNENIINMTSIGPLTYEI